MRRITLGLATLVATMAVAGVAVAATTTTVTEDDLGVTWGFVTESGAGGDGAIVHGPDEPPIGTGSAEFAVSDPADGLALSGAVFDGAVALADVDAWSYGTYRQTGGDAEAISLQLNIDYDATDTEDGWQGRLAFEPYYAAAVETGVWQTWDVLTQRGWWATGSPGNSECPIDDPCTWDEVVGAFPDAVIRAEQALDGAPALVNFKAGSGWSDFVGNVDGFTVTVAGETTEVNFQLTATVATDKDACKDGGWQTLVDEDGDGFRNQGECVSTVASEGKSGGQGEAKGRGKNR
ncbi:MAG: hypothetical protein WD638_11475 [Nitriliruptoraceae bacterium]